MNYKQLKDDLLKKCPDTYFINKFFPEDKEIYKRRSFGDLYKYYNNKGITEEQLLKALYECEFSAKICRKLNKVIFFKAYNQKDLFWSDNNAIGIGYLSIYTAEVCDKYTVDYLNNLFKTINFNEKENKKNI